MMHLCIIVFYRTKNAPHPQVAKIWWIFCGGPFRSGKYTIECKFAGVTHVIYCFTVVIQGSQVTRKQRFPMRQNTVLLPNNTKLTDDIQERWSHHQITFKSLWMYVNKKNPWSWSLECNPQITVIYFGKLLISIFYEHTQFACIAMTWHAFSMSKNLLQSIISTVKNNVHPRNNIFACYL